MWMRWISRRVTGARRWNITTASSFGFYAEARPDLPPVATGGRYDALTRAIGGGLTVCLPWAA